MNGMRVAVCHEWTTTFGGSEQVAQRLAHVLDASDVFTFTARPDLAAELYPGRRVHVHRLGATRAAREHWQRFLPTMPHAWANLDLHGFDLVITSSHACVNAIRVPTGTLHVSYCHTPMRYAWQWREELGRVPRPLRPAWPAAAVALRHADRSWSRHVDVFLANSSHVAARIRAAYSRGAEVVYPPVDTSYWTPRPGVDGDYFLVAGRLVAYKRAEQAILAAQLARVRLVVAGDGPELARLKRIAGAETEFVIAPDSVALRELYRGARALVVPGVEDFGMTMVEAQACGVPVIANASGGAREAVADGTTGVLLEHPGPVPLATAMARFDGDSFDPDTIRAHAEGFDVSKFDAAIERIVVGVSRGVVARAA
jgi:glycosyltransferase involved in cell wall biosynthesis